MTVSHRWKRGDPVGVGIGGDRLAQTATEDDPHAIESRHHVTPFIKMGPCGLIGVFQQGQTPVSPIR